MSSDSQQQFYSLNINSLQEPVLQKVCELLDQTSDRGWRKLAAIIAKNSRFRLSSMEVHQCSLKVMEPEGSPARSLLRLMGDQGCTTKELADFLQSLGQSNAIQILSPPGVKVVVHPESMAVRSGQMIKLCCVPTEHPVVMYQWFKMNKEVPYGNSSELVFNPVHVDDAGFYICRVNDSHTCDFSRWAKLEVIESNLACHGISMLPDNRLQICNQPQSQTLEAGAKLVLECAAIGKPLPCYQWYRNGVALVDATHRVYMIPAVSVEDQGFFYCRVSNGIETVDSKEVEVVVDELSGIIDKETSNEPLFATDKVALLIGNMSYKNHSQLKAPMVDVYELTNLLRQLDFKVVSLLDLTEVEMRNTVNEFLLLLDKGVYGLLYYAGHGYENFGNSFMVPIDAPKPYGSSNCLCVQRILKLMQEKETGLNVFLLDMCRKRNQYDDTILIPDNLKVTANIVFGYATCQGAEAFEIQHSDLANGIFMKFLKKRLLEDKKITVLLDEVGEDMGRCLLTKGMQALEIRSSLSARRALTDPIQHKACSPESLARNLQWEKANELKESMCIEFACGVKIKLGFAAEFSNVMIIYSQIISSPPDICHCTANVTDFPLDLYVDPKETNKDTPEETGSFLVSKDLPKHCLYTRLSSLQKLKENLTFTVCLTYTYKGVEEMVDESQKINLGKPLIAKLNIHSGLRSPCTQTGLIPQSPCTQPIHIPHNPSAQPSHTLHSPNAQPSHTLHSPNAQPSHTLHSPNTQPSHTLHSPSAQPSHTLHSPSAEPSHTLHSPIAQPSHTLHSPSAQPSHTLHNPSAQPSHTLHSPSEQPSHTLHSPSAQPSLMHHSPSLHSSHQLHSPCLQSSHHQLHSPYRSPETAAASSSVPRPSSLFTNPQYPQSSFQDYQQNIRSSMQPDNWHQYYSGYPSSSGRRHFPEHRSLYSNVSRHSNVPEESTEDFGYY
ncbi:mucosa-associated lymphoid tissue lymphoma translocation protein 1 isoform X2 [Hyla sarda]|uniref:mucosa-associated lymphoid tissue lymphoma translocation protein 1 isoform X2 n=1 Tax=Hyla sarda TaxID=327740 RepID=UPI0024C418FC|nr:mucosa-associated lymphoid tissue lymphoma translocation protein 1 isoform X2 [Hyla sarda]